MDRDVSKRAQILKQGIELTDGDRNRAYGEPYPNLTCFAHLVNCYLKGLGWTGGPKLDAVDGAVIMNLTKVSRIAANKNHADNYLDGAVYMAIAGECAEINTHEDVYASKETEAIGWGSTKQSY